MNKRYTREIDNHLTLNLKHEKGYYDSLVEDCYLVNHDPENYSATFHLNISNYIVKIKITLTTYYPFRPPEVLINGKKYRDLYTCFTTKPLQPITIDQSYYNFYYQRISNGDKIECPCCNSVLCADNWHPRCGMSSILQEIKDNITKSCRINELLHAQKVMQKYLEFTIPTVFQMI